MHTLLNQASRSDIIPFPRFKSGCQECLRRSYQGGALPSCGPQEEAQLQHSVKRLFVSQVHVHRYYHRENISSCSLLIKDTPQHASKNTHTTMSCSSSDQQQKQHSHAIPSPSPSPSSDCGGDRVTHSSSSSSPPELRSKPSITPRVIVTRTDIPVTELGSYFPFSYVAVHFHLFRIDDY